MELHAINTQLFTAVTRSSGIFYVWMTIVPSPLLTSGQNRCRFSNITILLRVCVIVLLPFYPFLQRITSSCSCGEKCLRWEKTGWEKFTPCGRYGNVPPLSLSSKRVYVLSVCFLLFAPCVVLDLTTFESSAQGIPSTCEGTFVYAVKQTTGVNSTLCGNTTCDVDVNQDAQRINLTVFHDGAVLVEESAYIPAAGESTF